jgi:zinc transport system substrate-binding protein
MLWEAEPTPATREKLEQRGVGAIVFDPCANRPREGDYLSVMRANSRSVRSALTR